MDFSICIGHREVNQFDCHECGNKVDNLSASQPLGLWATIHSIDMDLKDSGFEYEYRVCFNGSEKLHADTKALLDQLKLSKKITYYESFTEPLSPPTARQKCADGATGEYLVFFDNHILVKPGFFKRAKESMEKYNMDMLHSSTLFYLSQTPVYHYILTLKSNFWARAHEAEPPTWEPYRIAAGGHGGFIVRRSVFEEVGGYWDGFIGYGGEEIYFDLKMALLDKTNWIDPQLIHYHFAGNRGYKRHYTPDYFKNMMACANIIGDFEIMTKLQNVFATEHARMKSEDSTFDMYEEAYQRSKDHAKWLKSVRKRTLPEQLEYFKENNIQF